MWGFISKMAVFSCRKRRFAQKILIWLCNKILWFAAYINCYFEYTRTCARTHTHTRWHARTHTRAHTQIQNVQAINLTCFLDFGLLGLSALLELLVIMVISDIRAIIRVIRPCHAPVLPVF
jgi:hypothetical protein